MLEPMIYSLESHKTCNINKWFVCIVRGWSLCLFSKQFSAISLQLKNWKNFRNSGNWNKWKMKQSSLKLKFEFLISFDWSIHSKKNIFWSFLILSLETSFSWSRTMNFLMSFNDCWSMVTKNPTKLLPTRHLSHISSQPNPPKPTSFHFEC